MTHLDMAHDPSSPPEHHAVLHIEYDGTPYHGWARQPGGMRAVESDLLDAFAAVGCSDVTLRCAGRTDTGVHATGQVADARYDGSIVPERLAHALAGKLPSELAVRASRTAELGFDARGDATSRAYEYRLLQAPSPSPTRARYVYHHPRPLDRDALDAAAALVLGQHDFSAFTPARAARDHRFFHRTIVESRWIERGDELVYEIRANAFLRRMVRMLVGAILGVGRGELQLDDVRALLAGEARTFQLNTAPARGLCLVDVTWEPVQGLPLPPRWRASRPEGAAHPF